MGAKEDLSTLCCSWTNGEELVKLSTQQLSTTLRLWPGSKTRTSTREPSGSDGARALLLLHKQIMAVNKNQAGVCKGEEEGEGGEKAKWKKKKQSKKI